MTTLREAAQQALEILERLHGGCTDSDDGTVEAITIWVPEIIDALRAALAEPVEPDPWGAGYEAGYEAGVARRPAQPVQDHFPDATKMVQDADLWSAGYAAGYAAGMEECPAEPVQEPVAWMYEDTLPKEYPYDAMWSHSAVRDGVRMFPVFAPHQRKPLTREKAIALWADKSDGPSNSEIVLFARAVERAHGII